MSSHQARATRPRAWASVYSERFPPGPDGPAPGVGHHRPVSPGPGNLPHGQGYPIPCVPVLTASPWGLPLPTPQRLDGSDPQPWGPPWGPAWAHLCEVSTTERPSRTTARRLFHRKRRVLGSMPVVGSSWETAGVRWRETGPAPAPAPAPPTATHQEHHGRVPHQRYGRGQLPLVAPAVGARGPVCVLREPQVCQARARCLRVPVRGDQSERGARWGQSEWGG